MSNKNLTTEKLSTTENEKFPVDCLVGLPFYKDDYCQIYNCDSLTAMVALRPSKKDIVIVTDPPYGIGMDSTHFMTASSKTQAKNYGDNSWDKEKIKPIYFEMMRLISKNQIIFGGNYYNLGATSCYLIWDKDNGDSIHADCELAWTSFRSATRKIKHRWQGMLQQNMKEKEERFHPTQKPLAVMQWIIENYTTPADIIVDPFMGSGTTLAAAKSLGRKAIGMEINKAYCEIAVKRLLTTQIRMTL